MIGSEHKKERVSERLQNLNNQPRRRGYLPGCHMRATDVEGHAAYGIKTLQGNWAEERRDASYTDDKPVIPTELENAWKTTYTIMAEQGTKYARLQPSNTVNQRDLVDVIDGRHQCFPGHQPTKDPDYKEAIRTAHYTTTGTTYVNPRHVQEQAKEYVPPVLGGSPDAQPRAVMLRVKHKLLQRSEGTFAGMRRSLRVMDTSGNFRLNDKELQAGLARYQIPLSDAETSVLIRYFDHDGSGEVDITEFCRTLRGEMSDRRMDLVKKAYALLDANLDGVVRLDDIARLYDVSNHPDVRSGKMTEKKALQFFMSQWDANGDDVIELSEFKEYYADLSATIDNDQHFEVMMRNAWHISGGEGLCRNTSCRRVLVTHTTGRQTVEEIKNDLGIGPRDIDKMKENLIAQGITDVARIEVK